MNRKTICPHCQRALDTFHFRGIQGKGTKLPWCYDCRKEDVKGAREAYMKQRMREKARRGYHRQTPEQRSEFRDMLNKSKRKRHPIIYEQ